MTAPTLHTERLTLRPHHVGDFAAYEAVFATDHSQYMGGPIGQQQSWAMFCKDVAQWDLIGHGAWAVERKSDGAFVGQVGINGHPYFPETELGWLVLPNAARQGIGAEAAIAARAWAHETLKPASLVSYIHADNAASIALAEHLGAARDDQAEPCPYDNHVVYRHPQVAA